MDKNNESFLRKMLRGRGVSLLIVAALLLQLSGAVQYMFARHGIKQEVQQRARAELRVRNLEIQNVVNGVEVAVNNMLWAVEDNINNPEALYGIMSKLVETNGSITGCAVAYTADYFPKQGHWFEPYVARRDNGILERTQIGSIDHDYLQADWFNTGLLCDSGCWTEPYYDEAGAKATISTYAVAVKDASGRTVAVLGADVSLDWLADLFGQTSGAYTFLTSQTGRILACPDKTMVMQTTMQEATQQYDDTMFGSVNRAMMAGDSGDAVVRSNNGEKGYIYYTPVEGNTGWSMAVIFADKEIYAGLHRIGTWLTVLMLLGLGLLVFIMYRTVKGLRTLETVSSEKERIGSELKIASGIQMGMLPKTFPPYPDRDEVTMYGAMVPAKEVGGDLYDFYIRDGKLLFCIGDVSGKGVPASLMMAVTRSLFRSVSQHEDSTKAIMMRINDAMSEMNESSMFVTLFIGALDLGNGNLRYCNAGHCAPVLCNGSATPLTMDANIPVGVMPAWQYTEQNCTIATGNTVFLYTDGLTEAEDGQHRQFGEERMMDTLKQVKGLGPRRQVEEMMNTVHTFAGGADQSDDLTIMAIQFIHPSQTHSITLPNDVQAIPQLAEFIDSIAEEHNIDMSTAMSLNLAMEEAVVNVMKYAYAEGTRGEVTVTAIVADGTVAFTITDNGIAFDPTAVAEPDTSLTAEDRPIGGLGIHLVRNIMDSVTYERRDSKNILTLKKNITQ